jgi:hypothetical protein
MQQQQQQLQVDTVISINEHDQYSLTSQTSSTCNKGLDRVLLERNIEKLLERKESPQQSQLSSPSTPIHIPIQSQSHHNSPLRVSHHDRSRQPIDMNEVGLSLDNLSPRTRSMTIANENVAISMPELPQYEMNQFEDITPINEELPTPDISELSIQREEMPQPVGKSFN